MCYLSACRGPVSLRGTFRIGGPLPAHTLCWMLARGKSYIPTRSCAFQPFMGATCLMGLTLANLNNVSTLQVLYFKLILMEPGDR